MYFIVFYYILLCSFFGQCTGCKKVLDMSNMKSCKAVFYIAYHINFKTTRLILVRYVFFFVR